MRSPGGSVPPRRVPCYRGRVFPIDDPPLTIRLMRPEDANDVQRSRTEPRNARYSGWRPATVEEVAAHARAQDPSTIGRSPGVVQLVLEEHGVFVGDMGVQTHGELPVVELGIVLAPTAHGRGVASRSIRRVVEALFRSGVHRVTARADARNERSVRLFERLGWRREGVERQCFWDAAFEEWCDEVCFAVLGSEWPP